MTKPTGSLDRYINKHTHNNIAIKMIQKLWECRECNNKNDPCRVITYLIPIYCTFLKEKRPKWDVVK